MTRRELRRELAEKIYDLCLELAIPPTRDVKVIFDTLVEKGLLTRKQVDEVDKKISSTHESEAESI